MKIDTRNVEIWETIYFLNKWKVNSVKIEDFLMKANLCASPLCYVDFYWDEQEVKDILKSQLKEQLNNLN